MSDAAFALTANASATATRVAKAIKSLQDARKQGQRPLETLNDTTALDLDVRAQIDEVFLVLALLGEALLPLGAFDNTHYPQTLDEVQASISSGGHELMPTAFGALNAELQYVVTAGFSFCSAFAPMPVYRGFGAAVLGDWDWSCPDAQMLTKKAKAKAGIFHRLLERSVDPQPNRPVLLAFDHVIQMLQIKQVAFLGVKPTISGFGEQQPRYVPRKEKEVKNEIKRQKHWTKAVEHIGHPAPAGMRISTWAIPFATWTSAFSCKLLKSRDAWETIMTNQMDPGRLLHAFVCRSNLRLTEGQLLMLPPGTPAETLFCWLDGLPGMTHQIRKWSDLDMTRHEKTLGKPFCDNLGQYPLPDKFVMSGPDATHRSPGSVGSTSPVLSQSRSPPPYSPDGSLPEQAHEAEGRPRAPQTTELATARDPVELAETTALGSSSHVHQANCTSPSSADKHLSMAMADGPTALRSLTALRHKPTTSGRHPLIFVSEPRPPSPVTMQKAPPIVTPMLTPSSDPLVAVLKPNSPSVSPVVLPISPSSKEAAQDGTESIEGPFSLPAVPGADEPAERPRDSRSHKLKDNVGPGNSDAAARDSTNLPLAEDRTDATAETQLPAKIPGVSNSQTSDLYLRLLNAVANGDVSAQALQKILQRGAGSLDHARPEETQTRKDANLKPGPFSAGPYTITKTEGQSEVVETELPSVVKTGAM